MKYSYVAKCGYKGKKDFYFYTDEMYVDSLEDLDKVGPEEIKTQWARISPHPAPELIEWFPGLIRAERFK